jgi:hypothetical protein
MREDAKQQHHNGASSKSSLEAALVCLEMPPYLNPQRQDKVICDRN